MATTEGAYQESLMDPPDNQLTAGAQFNPMQEVLEARTERVKQMQAALADPFIPDELEWRILASGTKQDAAGNPKPWGTVAPYISNRAIMQRLDDVCGIDGWKNEMASTETIIGLALGLSVKINGDWITKWDGADFRKGGGVDGAVLKGAFSDAMKRASLAN